MLLAHKTELPTPEQAIYLDKACGSRRHCCNQLLEHFSQQENNWSKSVAYQYYIKTIRPQFDWYSEVSSRVTRNAIDDLDNGFKHFFRRVKAGKKAGFPKFKRCDCGLNIDRDFNVFDRLLFVRQVATVLHVPTFAVSILIRLIL